MTILVQYMIRDMIRDRDTVTDTGADEVLMIYDNYFCRRKERSMRVIPMRNRSQVPDHQDPENQEAEIFRV